MYREKTMEKVMEAEIFSKEVFSKTAYGTFECKLPYDKKLAKIYRYVYKSIQETLHCVNNQKMLSEDSLRSLWTKECCSFIIKYKQIKALYHLYIIDLFDNEYGTKDLKINFLIRYAIPDSETGELSIRAENDSYTFSDYPSCSLDAYLYRFLNGEISEILKLLPKTKEEYESMSLDEILKYFSER